MSRIVHARLDQRTEELLRQLQRRFGWNDSQVVREGIKTLAALLPDKGGRKIVGLGRFESGVPDLGSNPKHLRGFGK
ncbi:MAG: hypothetical protein GXP27_17930 [Planctomycetes bacterium]|nr:hypothetical protein [Planctomycetota bacterium]